MWIYLQYSESSMLKNACKNARPQRQLRNFSPVQNWSRPSKRRVDRSLSKTLLWCLCLQTNQLCACVRGNLKWLISNKMQEITTAQTLQEICYYRPIGHNNFWLSTGMIMTRWMLFWFKMMWHMETETGTLLWN